VPSPYPRDFKLYTWSGYRRINPGTSCDLAISTRGHRRTATPPWTTIRSCSCSATMDEPCSTTTTSSANDCLNPTSRSSAAIAVAWPVVKSAPLSASATSQPMRLTLTWRAQPRRHLPASNTKTGLPKSGLDQPARRCHRRRPSGLRHRSLTPASQRFSRHCPALKVFPGTAAAHKPGVGRRRAGPTPGHAPNDHQPAGVAARDTLGASGAWAGRAALCRGPAAFQGTLPQPCGVDACSSF